MNKDCKETFVIERLGNRGEGVARSDGRLVFIPYALAGESVRAEAQGDHARLIEVLTPSPDRVAPICPHYGVCGGCAVQALDEGAYSEWKRGLVVAALHNAGIEADVAPLVDAHGAGRRRVTFHARGTSVGFMRARSHDIIEIEACPLLERDLQAALPAARALAKALASADKPLDISATLTLEGLDIDIRGHGPLSESESKGLISIAAGHDLARLANHGRVVALRRKPHIAVGDALDFSAGRKLPAGDGARRGGDRQIRSGRCHWRKTGRRPVLRRRGFRIASRRALPRLRL